MKLRIKYARLSLLPLLLSQTSTTFPIPGQQLYEHSISILGYLLPVMIALLLLVILLSLPVATLRQLAGRLTEKAQLYRSI